MSEDKILYKGTWIVNVPKSFLFDTNLTLQARFLFCVLKSFTNTHRPEAFPSRDYLSRITGLSKNSVLKYLRELTGGGYIVKRQVRERGKFKHNLYLLKEPRTKICATVNLNKKRGESRLNSPRTKFTAAVNLTPNEYKRDSSFVAKKDISKLPGPTELQTYIRRQSEQANSR